MDDLLAMGITSPWVNKTLAAGRINPSMPKEQAYKAVADYFLESQAPKVARQMQLPLSSADATPDIRALIRYGTSGPGVPVTPARPTYYTPEMQAQALASGMESMATGPRVAQKQGGLIPSPIDPRRFTMGDVPLSTGYTPEMMEEAARQGIEIPIPRAAAETMDTGVRGLPGRVATPEELAAFERNRQMYGGAAGRADDIFQQDPSTALIPLGVGGRGIPVGGAAGGGRGLITTPSFADQMRSMTRRGLNGLGGGELLAAAGTAGLGGMLVDAMDGESPMTTGGEAELANESRPAPVVMPTQSKPDTEWAVDKADPAKEAKFTNDFKKGYAAQHPHYADLPDPKRKSVESLMRAGIPQQRANEIVRGSYSLSPAENDMLRRSR
jgi:hypothetical protein